MEPSGTASSNFFVKHFRGDYPLGWAYWVNGLLISGIAWGALGAATPWLLENYSARLASTCILLGFGAAFAIWMWALSGAWASASKHVNRGGKQLWASAAKLAIVLGILRAFADVAGALPVLQEYALVAAGKQMGPETRFELRADGKSLLLLGGINDGSAEALADALKIAPHVQTVVLQSSGGLIRQGKLLADEIKSRGLNTYVEGECTSACTVAFLAGRERAMDPQARLGFHAARMVGGGAAPDPFEELYRAAGVSQAFIKRAHDTPNSEVWYPSRDELLAAGVLTRLSEGGETAAVASSYRTRAALENDLKKTPLFAALARKYPAAFDEVAATAWKGVEERQQDREIMVAARAQVLATTGRLLALASDPVLLKMNQIVQDEAEALADKHPEACVQLAFGVPGTNVSSMLPRELVQRELEVLTEVVESSSQSHARKVDEEVMKSQYIAAFARLAPEDLEVLRSGFTSYPPARACHAGIAFYDAVNHLPEPGRTQVLRGFFSNR